MGLDTTSTILVLAQMERELDAVRMDQNKMSRLRDKLTQAKGVVADVTADIEAQADELIAMRSAIKQEAKDAFAPHLGVLADAKIGLSELRSEIREFSNSPPLDDSAPASNVSGAENPTRPQP